MATREPAAFLGFTLHQGGKRALDEGNVRRFKGKLRGMLAAWRAGAMERGDILCRVDAWGAHADYAHARRLKRAILGRAAKALRARLERPFARTA